MHAPELNQENEKNQSGPNVLGHPVSILYWWHNSWNPVLTLLYGKEIQSIHSALALDYDGP